MLTILVLSCMKDDHLRRICLLLLLLFFKPSVPYDPEGGLKKLLEKYENRYEKSIGAVISR